MAAVPRRRLRRESAPRPEVRDRTAAALVGGERRERKECTWSLLADGRGEGALRSCGERASEGVTGTHAGVHARRQAHKQKDAGFGAENAIAVPVPLGHERFRHEIARAMDILSISDTEIDGVSETRACRGLDGRTRPGCPP
ncbi:hypothetical protein GCM10023205_03010 [Yinghuangia aomiensis]|uniref:Uncharacterized protein n=1 Tax=Yinghuangia aomiensis TaxID=676205 RepID=A0ABP9GP30_9ACTN